MVVESVGFVNKGLIVESVDCCTIFNCVCEYCELSFVDSRSNKDSVDIFLLLKLPDTAGDVGLVGDVSLESPLTEEDRKGTIKKTVR